jgi:N-acetylglucosamine-6-phosphate deacetylase
VAVTTLGGGRIVTPAGVIEDGWLQIEAGTIKDVGDGVPPARPDQDLAGAWVLPGFVDIHCHGGGDASYMTGDQDDAVIAADTHRRHGTTTTMASLVTGTPEHLELAVTQLAELAESGLLAGIHLEGPFLSTQRCGAHDPGLLRPPEPELVDRLLKAGRGAVRMVTLAPELDHGIDAVRRVVDGGAIAAVGHTDASYEQTQAAIDAGATVATHLFNAMRPLHHREPGPIAALLEDGRVRVELIGDGVHLHPSVVRTAVAAAGADRVVLVTDAMDAAGAGDGDYRLGGLLVRVTDGVARLVDGGAIAGSTLTMDRAVKFAVAAGVPVPDAAVMAATAPARALGLDDRLGSIAAGLDADLVRMDAQLDLTGVMVKGSWLRE